ncbi:hypothetical protein E3N88_38049 [Mikania micrantha]|uniref:Uncharacterized protein n=1 Tax=Mikania micrantha TaxID=192012 RepID=A0A5N6LVB8_9ASTR|nr:hypothetical protein E3N88_38049 [Mikania micrantha]
MSESSSKEIGSSLVLDSVSVVAKVVDVVVMGEDGIVRVSLLEGRPWKIWQVKGRFNCKPFRKPGIPVETGVWRKTCNKKGAKKLKDRIRSQSTPLITSVSMTLIAFFIIHDINFYDFDAYFDNIFW